MPGGGAGAGRASLKRYRAAVLKAAVEGRLTEKWRAEHPDVEPASKLLERILTERRQKWEAAQLAKFAAAGREPPRNWKSKYVEPKPPDTTNLPDLPAGWTWRPPNNYVSDLQTVLTLPPPFVAQGIPFIFVQHIVGGSIVIENTKFITKEVYDELNARCPVERGDVLYSAVGSYGVAVKVATDQPFAFQRHIAHLKPSHLLNGDYVVHCLNSNWCLWQAHRVARGVAQKTVTLSDLRRFVLPLAPTKSKLRLPHW